MPTPGFGGMFQIMFTVVPIIVIGMFIYIFASKIMTWTRNNAQPVLTDPAMVVTKRTHTWGHHGGGAHHHGGAHTSYYATFEFEEGERQEFFVGHSIYGQLAEGDTGMLTYQGTRFHDFERDRW